MTFRAYRPLLLASIVAIPALAYPTPEEMRDRQDAAKAVASEDQTDFNTTHFDKLALRMEASLGRTADEMSRARKAMREVLLADPRFIAALQDYKGLIGAYSEILDLYEQARVEVTKRPDDASAKTSLENLKQARNTVFSGLKIDMNRIETRYTEVRAEAKF